jgi:hypothetical protein
MVRFVAEQESVSVEETAASVDSAASSPSKAGNTEHPKKVEYKEDRQQHSEAREQQNDAPRVYTATEPKESDLVEKEKQQEDTQKEPERDMDRRIPWRACRPWLPKCDGGSLPGDRTCRIFSPGFSQPMMSQDSCERDFESVGRRFKSCRAYHNLPRNPCSSQTPCRFPQDHHCVVFVPMMAFNPVRQWNRSVFHRP